MIETIFKLVLCHLLGDYFFQSPFLADTKGKNWYHLWIHCMLYILPFYFVFGWTWQLLVLGVLHFIIDALKARWGKISYTQDQLLHYALLGFYLI